MHKSHKKRKSHNKRSNQQVTNLKEIDSEDICKLNDESEEFDSETGTFTVRHSDVMGRYVVASRDLKPGTIIISEKPLVVGPCTDSPIICLGCYYNFEKEESVTPIKCPGCGWPLCSTRCPGLNKEFGHTTLECKALSKSGAFKTGDTSPSRAYYSAIVPLRCLLLEKEDSARYCALMRMESHNEIRRKIPTVWEHNQKNVVNRIITEWGLKEFDEELVHTVCGILEVNAFEVGQHGTSIRAIYPTAFLLAHDCVPNTTHTDEDTCYKLTVRSSTFIPTGQSITLSYAYTLQGTLKRREHLAESKFFACACTRCSDPMELGTHASTLLCPRCGPGLVVSTEPLDANAPWRCNNTSDDCPGYSVTGRSMRLLMEKIADEVESIDGNDVEGYEAFLQRYRNVLHPNHYHCLGVKHSLSQIYGKINGYLIYELSRNLLNRKKDICKDILTVFDVLEPGYSRLRGVTLYELHAPIMILATRAFEIQNITKNELKEQLKEVVKCLKESSIILGFEPDHSSEGVMANAAKDALHKIRDWERILGKIC